MSVLEAMLVKLDGRVGFAGGDRWVLEVSLFFADKDCSGKLCAAFDSGCRGFAGGTRGEPKNDRKNDKHTRY